MSQFCIAYSQRSRWEFFYSVVCSLIFFLCLFVPSAFAGKLDSDIKQGADEVIHGCLPLMHHDTDEFSACVDALLTKKDLPLRTQLGISYAGLVGCLSANRMATEHSEICSRTYLNLHDRLKRRVAISDQGMCVYVMGHCASRVALIQAMRAVKP